jgi:hypothetical protein
LVMIGPLDASAPGARRRITAAARATRRVSMEGRRMVWGMGGLGGMEVHLDVK